MKTVREVCYWKGLVKRAEIYDNPCKICQKFKNRKTLYGHLSPNNTEEIKPWDLFHVDLMGTYIKSTRQQHPGGATIRNNVSLTCMTKIDPTTVYFVEIYAQNSSS